MQKSNQDMTNENIEASVNPTTEIQQGGNLKKDKSRSFKVKLNSDGDQYGRYSGDSPYQAANKALSEIIRNKIKNNHQIDDEISFFLVESTKGKVKKIHQYLGQRIKLETPVQYSVAGGQVIVKQFKNILRKVKKVDGKQKKTKKSQVANLAHTN